MQKENLGHRPSIKKSKNFTTHQFYDDSIPEEAKLLIYSLGNLKKKEIKTIKSKPYFVRKSSSMHDLREESFREDLILPKDLNCLLFNTIKEVKVSSLKIYQ